MFAFGDPFVVHYPLVQCSLGLSFLTLAPAWMGEPTHWPYLVTLMAALWMVRVAYGAFLLREHGRPATLDLVWALPLNDLVLAAAFVVAMGSRTVEWRGRRYRLLRGGRLQRIEGSPSP